MPRLSLSERFRIRMQYLLREHGTAAQLVAFSARRPHGSHIRPQDLSYFKHATPGRKSPIRLDHLEDIAAFFNCSVGSLLGVSRASELNGEEQRVLAAFQTLPDDTRGQFLGLIEAASLHGRPKVIHKPPRVGRRRTPPSKEAVSKDVYSDDSSTAHPVSAEELLHISTRLSEITVELAATAASLSDRQSAPGTRPETPGDRVVGDELA